MTITSLKQTWDSRVADPAHKAAGNELVFVQAGDFFETFDEHAKIAARVLGLALTSRGGLAMAGFPFHHSSAYAAKLVSEGYRACLIGDDVASLMPSNVG